MLTWHVLVTITPRVLHILPPSHLSCLIDKSKWVWVISSAFAYEFASSWLLGEHWLLDSCYSWWFPPPRWLGGSGGAVARVVLVLGHLPVFCEGCCAFPGGAPKATLVNCSCHWVTSLTVGSYGALGELGFGLPISHRTTKWWSTQRGCSMPASTWTSGEKLCVTFVIDLLDFSRWLVFILLWLGYSSMRWY
jgi:hypothetical protein